MVTYKLIKEGSDSIKYWYYPEGDETKRHGVIKVNKTTDTIKVTRLAEGDVRIEPEPGISITLYGTHAIKSITDDLNRGYKPRDGVSMWY